MTSQNNRDFEETSPLKERNYAWRWAALALLLIGAFSATSIYRIQSNKAIQVVVDHRWHDLEKDLNGMVREYGGEVGIYMKNLRTGQVYSHNADRAFISASLIKMPIMAATFHSIWEGNISLNTKIQYKRRYRRGGAGQLKWATTGNYYSISHLVYAMMTKSDNTATAMLIDKLGYGYLNKCFSDLGLTVTRISHEGMSLSSRLDPAKDNYTTPWEMGVLLEKLYRHEVINDGLSDLMVEIMKGAKSRSRLAHYLPSEFEFARKTGLLRQNCHDVGIVFTPQGDYVLCVLTGQNISYGQAKGFIAQVGRTAYSYMTSS